jgi:UDP-glucose 4-epimerase
MNILVTGGAGFIGSHLVDSLSRENDITVIDNLSCGKLEFVNNNASFVEADLLTGDVSALFEGQDIVYHFAANPDVRIGTIDTGLHLEQNILATYRVLETMRRSRVRKIVFTSTSTVYGEAPIPTSEDWGPLLPISLYGASKLACEGLISAYCHSFGFQAWVFRLANVIGPRSTHGVIYDFVRKLRENPAELEILGNGRQTKSYIYIDDCIGGIARGLKSQGPINLFNLGSRDQITIERIAEIVVEEMGLNANLCFTGGERGWKGDVPVMLLSSKKLNNLGWRARFNSEASVRATVKSLVSEPTLRDAVVVGE